MVTDGHIAFDVLMLIGSAAPVALYFLSLGLINCHARPCLISTRADFIALSIALAPLPLWSLPIAIQLGSGWMLGLAALLLAFLFRKLLPGRYDGLVVYNISRRNCLELLDRAIRRQDGDARRVSEGEWELSTSEIRISARSLTLLRTVSIQIGGSGRTMAAFSIRLRRDLDQRLAHVEQLPSPVGAGLVLTGLGIAVVPMWLMTRHIHDLVDVVVRIFG